MVQWYLYCLKNMIIPESNMNIQTNKKLHMLLFELFLTEGTTYLHIPYRDVQLMYCKQDKKAGNGLYTTQLENAGLNL